MYPLKIGSAAQFKTLREFLSDAGYTEQAVCQRLGIPSIYEFKTLHEGRSGSSQISDRLDALIRFFMDEEAVDHATLALQFEADALRVMEELALIKRRSGDSDQWYADAVLYPQERLFIASDRTFQVEKSKGASLPEDVVYASITRNTGRFVSVLPSDPCGNFLDLCSGTGIGALIAGARYAQQAWACDLSGRCTHFADFNRRLNGIENVHAEQGDLYAPVEGLQFDRIVAHPPYVPAEEQQLMFRDGGQDGEQILRGIVQGLPRFLRPGGRFYTLTLATDREGETIEQRVRQWLGDAEAEFDVFLVFNEAERRPNTILQAVVEAKGKLGELGPRSKLYERLKVEAILYGVIVVERHQTMRAPLTARGHKSRTAGSEIVEWFRNWQIAAARPEFENMLLRARPHPAAGFFLVVTHAAQEGSLRPVEFRARANHELKSDARIEPWVAVLIGACDGSKTVRELFGYLKEQEVIATSMGLTEFSSVLKVLLESGFLEVPDFLLPPVKKTSAEASATVLQGS